jgi:hypothetical protein
MQKLREKHELKSGSRLWILVIVSILIYLSVAAAAQIRQ